MEKPLLRNLRGQSLRMVPLRKGPDLRKGPGTYKKTLTNINFKEKHPEDKLTEDDQDKILEELETVFGGRPKGQLPHLRSFRLEGSALIYVCANQ
jgi:hypothetical protein